MTDYLCETCRHRHGRLRVYHRVDSDGIERAYACSVKVRCSASAKYPNMVKDAKQAVAYYEPWQVCIDYDKRKGA